MFIESANIQTVDYLTESMLQLAAYIDVRFIQNELLSHTVVKQTILV